MLHSLTVLLFIPNALGRVPLWAGCSVSNNHLDADTKEFITDCDSFGYCAINGTCLPRQCRRDEFVLTSLLQSNLSVPERCPSGTFCPDDSSGCLPLVVAGGRCQLNRDDECSPPPTPQIIPNPWDLGGEGDGAICLLGICQWANITLGSVCIAESTTYTGYDVSGISFTNEVIRDNCIEGQGYCDTASQVCLALKMIHDPCSADRVCQSYHCHPTDLVCIEPPESAVHVAKWVYALVGLGLSFGMIVVVCLLVLMHRRAQSQHKIMLEEHYREQTAYRSSILSLHSVLTSQTSLDERDTELVRRWSGAKGEDDWEKEEMYRSMSDLSDTTMVNEKQ